MNEQELEKALSYLLKSSKKANQVMVAIQDAGWRSPEQMRFLLRQAGYMSPEMVKGLIFEVQAKKCAQCPKK